MPEPCLIRSFNLVETFMPYYPARLLRHLISDFVFNSITKDWLVTLRLEQQLIPCSLIERIWHSLILCLNVCRTCRSSPFRLAPSADQPPLCCGECKLIRKRTAVSAF